MTTVTIHKAKTNLSRLIDEVMRGGEVVIAKGKTPMVRMVPVAEPTPKRVPGRWKGQVTIGPEFFEPMSDEELKLWEGGDDVSR